ncbi:histidine--tRNA ligase [Sphingomonas alba]|uniref:Histidine--tRNA ligase n=1 Tax=Sphingomonas alba TaxID=2908208 RepID=A0ABT0RMW4_9SPHN|nr:histidine--tRNA ligase [Sphingomonas alba]MCL6683935.1 histidine--tRNA ligase [Sphingomonas alba]
MAKIETPQPVRGTQSLLGEEADRFHAVISAFDRVRRLFGFRRVEVPVIEPTAVFARTIGETTDVVSKEMYSFEDRSGDSITLRPELTAGIARAYISEGWQQHAPLKIATWGAAFRYERPQKGRFRQFHQLDAEILGAGEPAADVEAIGLAAQLLAELGLSERSTLHLNTLGDPETRTKWRDALHAHFSKHRAALSDESQSRLDRNPLRILDSKAHQDWPFADSAPGIDDFLTVEAGQFFEAVTKGLDAAGIAWVREPRLVRGLDYYRHTAFEFVTEELGAQAQLLGGGRYDGLMESLGGPHTPAIGWAAGIERLAMMVDAPASERPDAVIVPLGEAGEQVATKVLASLRSQGIAADMAFRGNMKKRMAKADAAGARFALIIGESEVEAGVAQVKDLQSGEQNAIAFDKLAEALRR